MPWVEGSIIPFFTVESSQNHSHHLVYALGIWYGREPTAEGGRRETIIRTHGSQWQPIEPYFQMQAPELSARMLIGAISDRIRLRDFNYFNVIEHLVQIADSANDRRWAQIDGDSLRDMFQLALQREWFRQLLTTSPGIRDIARDYLP